MFTALIRIVWSVGVFLAAFVLLPAQEPRRSMPPEIFDNPPRDIARLDSRHYRMDFENDKVRVLHAQLDAGYISPSYDTGPGTIVALTELHLRFTRTINRRTYEVHLQSGEVRWIPADTHFIQNLSRKQAEFVFVEVK